jgi:glycosyltransferase involved in cell wall biosynthesis
MRLLYLSYWGISEALTQSTVLPHLEVLQTASRIEQVIFVSVERGHPGLFRPGFDASRIRHIDLRAHSLLPRIPARALDFMRLPTQLATLCRREGIDCILARGAAAGALAELTQRHVRVPYIVESFEPHAEYMRESGVWNRWDPRYLSQRRWERAQKQRALALLPVAEAYRQQLLSEGLSSDRVITLPCTVDTDQFRFSEGPRQQIRRQLDIADDEVVGVYAGKFGGIYYDRESFEVFGRFAARLPRFRLVVLSPEPAESVRQLADAAGFPRDRLFVTGVPHAAVPHYLSAADVAFATIRIAPSRRFCSAVKIGEYWAAGLPLVITENVGDDSDIVERERVGAVINLAPASVDAAVDRVRALLDDPGHRGRIAQLARRHRSRARVREAYAQLGWFC